MQRVKLIVDADYLCYRGGFAVERKRYTVVAPTKEEGATPVLLGAGLDYEAAKKLADSVDGSELYSRKVLEPFDNALLVVGSMLRETYAKVAERFNCKPELVLLLSGYSNFRERIAAVARYKHNRVEKEKPTYYGKLRKYLVDERDAQIVHWYEADDECGILLTEDRANTVVASIDKDLLQVPGWHFNPDKHDCVNVTASGGLMRFYGQALSGDSTDGVPGCYGMGPAKTTKAMLKAAAGCKTLTELERKLWAAVLAEYRASHKKHGPDKCGYDDPDAAALETARLVYLLRERPKDPTWVTLWEPPK